MHEGSISIAIRYSINQCNSYRIKIVSRIRARVNFDSIFVLIWIEFINIYKISSFYFINNVQSFAHLHN